MVLNKQQMERIGKALMEKDCYKGVSVFGLRGRCEACGEVHKGKAGFVLDDKTGLQQLGKAPAVMLSCINCGNVRFHLLKALGLEDLV